MKSHLLFYRVSRYLMAVLFIFSGLAKAVNPFGLSIQLGEYFSAMHLDFLSPLAELGAIVLPAVETLLGLMLLVGLNRKLTSWAVLLFMSFFTLLTLWITIYNPVTDCGCFGDLLKISNLQTFIKNIVLMPFAIILFVWRGRVFTNSRGERLKKAPLWLYLVVIPLSFALPVFSSQTLPILDATPYKIGVNISQSMKIPEGTPQTEYHTMLIYKEIATGKVHEFELEDTTWYDSSKWEYVDSQSKVIGSEYSANIKSLPMLDAQSGADVAQEILQREGYQLLIVANDWTKLLSQGVLDEIQRVGAQVPRVVILTSSSLSSIPQQINNLILRNGFELLGSDYTVLNTMIQSHKGGAILLNNGTIIGKWSMNRLPNKIY